MFNLFSEMLLRYYTQAVNYDAVRNICSMYVMAGHGQLEMCC